MKDFDSHNHIFGSDNRCQICDAHAPEPPAFLRRQTTDYECAISMLAAQTVAKSKLLGENLVLKARIAELEARLATAEAEVVRLRDEAEDLRFHLGCESVAKDGYLTECEAASAVIADLRAKCEAAETKATISQITAETEKRLRESSERDAERECLWSSDGFNDLWESSCGMAWTFPDEGPKENDMTYCPKCRGVLVVDSND